MKGSQVQELAEHIFTGIKQLSDIAESKGISIGGRSFEINHDGTMRVQICSGIQNLADMMGCELLQSTVKIDQYPIKWNFFSAGIEYFAIGNESERNKCLYGYARARDEAD